MVKVDGSYRRKIVSLMGVRTDSISNQTSWWNDFLCSKLGGCGSFVKCSTRKRCLLLVC